jgi:hypothetical protein
LEIGLEVIGLEVKGKEEEETEGIVEGPEEYFRRWRKMQGSNELPFRYGAMSGQKQERSERPPGLFSRVFLNKHKNQK